MKASYSCVLILFISNGMCLSVQDALYGLIGTTKGLVWGEKAQAGLYTLENNVFKLFKELISGKHITDMVVADDTKNQYVFVTSYQDSPIGSYSNTVDIFKRRRARFDHVQTVSTGRRSTTIRAIVHDATLYFFVLTQQGIDVFKHVGDTFEKMETITGESPIVSIEAAHIGNDLYMVFTAADFLYVYQLSTQQQKFFWHSKTQTEFSLTNIVLLQGQGEDAYIIGVYQESQPVALVLFKLEDKGGKKEFKRIKRTFALPSLSQNIVTFLKASKNYIAVLDKAGIISLFVFDGTKLVFLSDFVDFDVRSIGFIRSGKYKGSLVAVTAQNELYVLRIEGNKLKKGPVFSSPDLYNITNIVSLPHFIVREREGEQVSAGQRKSSSTYSPYQQRVLDVQVRIAAIKAMQQKQS